MNKITIIVLLCLTFIKGCNSVKGELVIDRKTSELPVKFSVGFTGQDSSKIRLYVPQELSLTNNFPYEIQHSKTYISITGANISNGSKNPLYEMDGGLVRLPERNFETGQGEDYIFYAGYTLYVPNSERDSLLKKAQFAQMMRKNKIFNLGDLKSSKLYLNRKVSDSLKGFLHLDFYNFKTDLGFVENVPIQF